MLALFAIFCGDRVHPLNNCSDLVLPKEPGCPLVTADARFDGKARSVFEHVQTLGR
jgi:hypothetical protein